MKPLDLTVADYDALRARSPKMLGHLNAWIEKATGLPLTEALITRLRLGEGVLLAERATMPLAVDLNGDVITEWYEYPVDTLPPVWVEKLTIDPDYDARWLTRARS